MHPIYLCIVGVVFICIFLLPGLSRKARVNGIVGVGLD